MAVDPELRAHEVAQVAVLHRHVEAPRRVAGQARQHHDGIDRAAEPIVARALNLLGLPDQMVVQEAVEAVVLAHVLQLDDEAPLRVFGEQVVLDVDLPVDRPKAVLLLDALDLDLDAEHRAGEAGEDRGVAERLLEGSAVLQGYDVEHALRLAAAGAPGKGPGRRRRPRGVGASAASAAGAGAGVRRASAASA
ncbi:MAG TPA: hypothetical protein VFS43_01000 [Polyangiaceae bacterium]|nr:hypothetical protein [Polyangiaceae bacterium]